MCVGGGGGERERDGGTILSILQPLCANYLILSQFIPSVFASVSSQPMKVKWSFG